MKLSNFICMLCLLCLSCSDPVDDGFVALFDGRNWTGWEGNQDHFRIEDGAIVAGSLEAPIPRNEFLCTEKSYRDFELRMKVKFTSRDNNAGIQFRSSRIPNDHEVIGYQADIGFMGESPLWGSLYDESRRKRFLLEAPADKVLEVLKPDDWNDYRILCEGPSIKFWLNDTLVLEYEETEENISGEGVICVQIHGGPAAEAWYKNIEIKEL